MLTVANIIAFLVQENMVVIFFFFLTCKVTGVMKLCQTF